MSAFTLVELIVVVAMMGILTLAMIGIINPLGQIQKAQDLQREHDLTQVNASLDAYFNDNNCYPKANTFSFGGSWSQGSTVYMTKVPQDPACSGGNNCYVYLTDNSDCSQWNVLLAKVSSTAGPKISCILAPSCFPAGYAGLGYNYCVVSGNPGQAGCALLSQMSPPAPPSGGGGSATASPTPPSGGGGSATPTPTPTQSPVPPQNCQFKNWDCRSNPSAPGGHSCNNVCSPGIPGYPDCNNGNYCDGTCGGQC